MCFGRRPASADWRGALWKNGCCSFRRRTASHHTKEIHLHRKNNIGRNSCPIYLRRVNNGLRPQGSRRNFSQFWQYRRRKLHIFTSRLDTQHTLGQQQGMGVLITCLCALKNVQSTHAEVGKQFQKKSIHAHAAEKRITACTLGALLPSRPRYRFALPPQN